MRSWGAVALLFLITPLVLLPSTFLSSALQATLTGGLFFFCLVVLLVQRVSHSPLCLLILLILCWLPVNVWVAIEQTRAITQAGYLLLGVAYYLVFTRWSLTRQSPVLLTWLLVGMGTCLAFLGPRMVDLQSGAIDVYALLGVPSTFHLTRFGEVINANVLAGALLLILPFPLMFLLDGRWVTAYRLRLGIAFLLLLLVVVIGSTQSRGAYLSAGIVIIFLLILRWPRLIYTVPLLLGLGAAFMVWAGPQQLLEALVFSTATPGLDQRLEIWSRAWYALWDFSFTGIGIGAFDIVIPLLYPYFLIAPTETIPHAHNLYLQIGLDLGMPGLLAFLALWINLWVMIVSLLRQREQPQRWILAAGAAGSLLGLALHGLVDAVLWGNKLAFLPWWLYALITVSFLQQQERN